MSIRLPNELTQSLAEVSGLFFSIFNVFLRLFPNVLRWFYTIFFNIFATYFLALKSSQRQVSTTTERNEVHAPKIESVVVSTVRPSHDHRRTQKLLNSFASLNINSNSNGKTVPTSKDKPKLKTAFRPASDYDYYDDGDSVIGKSTSKVRIFFPVASYSIPLPSRMIPIHLNLRVFRHFHR